MEPGIEWEGHSESEFRQRKAEPVPCSVPNASDSKKGLREGFPFLLLPPQTNQLTGTKACSDTRCLRAFCTAFWNPSRIDFARNRPSRLSFGSSRFVEIAGNV
jgi:hypothetical protein